MAKVAAVVKLQLNAGRPVTPACRQCWRPGINIVGSARAQPKTADQVGTVIPVEVTVRRQIFYLRPDASVILDQEGDWARERLGRTRH